jgi:hypothetical protein
MVDQFSQSYHILVITVKKRETVNFAQILAVAKGTRVI